MKTTKKNGFTLIELLVVITLILFLIIIPLFLGKLLDDNMEWFLSYLKGSQVDIPNWLIIVLLLFFNVPFLFINILIYLFKLYVI